METWMEKAVDIFVKIEKITEDKNQTIRTDADKLRVIEKLIQEFKEH